MDYINVLKELNDIVLKEKEIVIYAQGGEGERLMDWMMYLDRIGNVVCVAESPGQNLQRFVDGCPIVPLVDLPQFRETATFLVAAPMSAHKGINDMLTEFGAKKIVFLSAVLHAKVTQDLNNLFGTGRFALWTTKNLFERMNAIEQRVAEQNEVSAAHAKAFAEYHHRFHNNEVVIVSSGETLQYYTPIEGAIHIGVDLAWQREDIPFDFLFVKDFNDENKELINSFDNVTEKVFVGKYLDVGKLNLFVDSRDIEILSDKMHWYYPTATPSVGQFLCQDICHHTLADFGSAAFSALHFALYTYPKRIYLVGFDGVPTDEFTPIEAAFEPMFKVGLSRMKMFAQKLYDRTEIVSLNPTALKEVFRDIRNDAYNDAYKHFKKATEEPVEDNAVENDAVEGNAVENNAAENSAAENNVAESNAVENNAVKNNAADGNAAESNSAEDKVADKADVPVNADNK